MYADAEHDSHVKPGHSVYPALAVSLLFHSLILAGFAVARFPEPDKRPEARVATSLQVTLVARGSKPESSSPLVRTEDAQPQPDLPEAAAQEPEVESMAEVEQQQAVAPARIESQVVLPGESGQTQAPGFSAVTLQAAISGYGRTLQPELNRSWVANCLIYQKEHGTQSCPQAQIGEQQVRAVIREDIASVFNKPDRQARISADYQRHSAAMESLLTQAGPVGALARERYFLDREYFRYLNGNANFGIIDYVRASQSGNGNLNVVADTRYQFTCRKMPCVYDYTGFSITKLQALLEAEAARGDFKPVTTLFGTRR